MTVVIEGCKIGTLQEIVIAVIILDTVLGVLQAIKTKKFNSSFGTNGAIRKVAMIATIITMIFVDQITTINLISFVPKEILSALNIEKVGLADFFSLLYILFEAVSILKKMKCLKLPVFQKMNVWIENILKKFIGDTQEKEGNDSDNSDCN